MPHPAIAIDANTGEVTVDGFTIRWQLGPDDLPREFAVGPLQQVQVGEGTLPVRFARAIVCDEDIPVRVELRFEDDVLARCFFEVSDSSLPEADADPLYTSTPKRELQHLRWLKKKLGTAQERWTSYPWGSAGVAIDQGGGVFAFVSRTTA